MGSEAYDLAVWGGNLGKCKMSEMFRNAIRSLAHLTLTYSAEFVLQSDYGFGLHSSCTFTSVRNS